jgi:NAD(P)-dependent dehydrogenase (short-subunit alcohol dehydrogenase family)
VLARELQPYGVRCNAIAPVAFTRMTEELWGSGMFAEDNRVQMGPEGIAAVVGWLASPAAEDVSGQVIGIHGLECVLWDGWRPVARARTSAERWTIDDAVLLREQLFAGRHPGVPEPPPTGPDPQTAAGHEL